MSEKCETEGYNNYYEHLPILTQCLTVIVIFLNKNSSEFSLYTQSTLERWQVSSSEIITPNNVTSFF